MYGETRKEAKLTLMCLAIIIAFWFAAGKIFSGVEVSISYVPIWAIFGTIGVWFTAIILSVFLSRNIH